MRVNCTFILLLAFTCICFVAKTNSVSPLTYDKQKLLNWCLKSKHHKKTPGKEMNLNDQCKPWQRHSCCSEKTSSLSHGILNQYNFNLNHCQSQKNVTMSESCMKHFIRDLCFYECEPSIGLWVVRVQKKFTKERFFGVPLCASSCDEWFFDCLNDFTCAYNWHTDFKWINGTNLCGNSTCRQFKHVYKDARDFCESVWDNSWKYTSEDQPCMKISFDDQSHNERVAEYYIDAELSLINNCQRSLWNLNLIIFSLLISIVTHNFIY